MDSRVDMINSFTGTVMSVPVELAAQYLAAGHRMAETAPPTAADDPPPRDAKTPPTPAGKSGRRK